MRTSTKIGAFLLLLSCSISFGQLNSYDQKIALKGTTDQWHTIPLPNTLFSHVKNNLADIRIYGITKTDTLEAPYVFRVSDAKGALSKIDFSLINTSSNENGYFFTYEVPTTKSINEIQLNIKNDNFDWNVMLEGSQNQREWFTLLEDYRIVSIKNSQTNYSFTNLQFSNAKYRYYRLLMMSDVKPELLRTTLYLDSIIPSTYQEYPVANFEVTEEGKNTILTTDLNSRIPVSYMKIGVMDKIDYYRPVEIQYVSDSVNTEKGWRYSYRTLTTGTLSSLEENEFKFNSYLAKKLRVVVQNYDNQPLTFSKPIVKGYRHELIARFDKSADYYLAYGNNNARAPIYDISGNGFVLPKNLKPVTLGQPQTIQKSKLPRTLPLFENKWWLWGIMGIVILVLGAFTIKMMRSSGHNN
ncbi:DUF3999 family protein [Maribacter aestuarii]|uniref:DUF3999 family protein n=1 Tax=Maribacter aestuarii TaxID=1130723 RepID=UPI00248B1695|nr:DUF3999 family protein [Maribacter aestuarii]